MTLFTEHDINDINKKNVTPNRRGSLIRLDLFHFLPFCLIATLSIPNTIVHLEWYSRSTIYQGYFIGEDYS